MQTLSQQRGFVSARPLWRTIAPIPGQGGRMLRRFAVLVLFSLAGSVAGAEASWYGLHYYPRLVRLA